MIYKPYRAYKESNMEWIGDIPIHWEIKKAKYIFKEVNKKNYPTEELLSVMKGKGLVRRKDVETGVVMAFKDLQNFKLVKPNQFVIHLRSFQSGFEMSRIKGIVSPAYSVFELRNQEDNPFFYKYLFYCETFINYLSSLVLSMRDGKPIPYKQFGDMLLFLPPKNEQKIISDFLDEKLTELDLLIDVKQKHIEVIRKFRRSFITEMVTRGLNPKVKMKDSHIEWIGKIPDHWVVKKLKYITKQIIDGTHHTPTYVDDGIPFLRVTDITKSRNNELKLDEVAKIPENEHKELTKRCKPEHGDLLVSKNGTIGVPKVVDWNFSFSIFVSLCLIKFKNGVNPYYVAFNFESSLLDEQIALSGKKSTITNLHLDKIKEISIMLPPKEEQDQIVKFLKEKTKEIDELIALIESQIETLFKYRQSIIYEVITGKIDIRNFKERESKVKK